MPQLLIIILLPLRCTLFPYTTLFRSQERFRERGERRGPVLLVDRHPGPQGAIELEERRRRVEAREAGTELERSEEHTSELQSPCNLVCRLLLEKKKKKEQ